MSACVLSSKQVNEHTDRQLDRKSELRHQHTCICIRKKEKEIEREMLTRGRKRNMRGGEKCKQRNPAVNEVLETKSNVRRRKNITQRNIIKKGGVEKTENGEAKGGKKRRKNEQRNMIIN